jgi:hypothetical protein
MFKKIIALGLLSIFSLQIASAQTFSAAQTLPSKIEFFVEINPQKAPNFKKFSQNISKTFLENSSNSTDALLFIYALESEQIILTALTNSKDPYDQDEILMIKATQEKHKNLISSLLEAHNKDSRKNYDQYIEDFEINSDEYAFTETDWNYFNLETDPDTNLETLNIGSSKLVFIDNYTFIYPSWRQSPSVYQEAKKSDKTLAQSQENLSSKFNPNATINIYVSGKNLNGFFNNYSKELVNLDQQRLFQSLYLSITETAEGLEFDTEIQLLAQIAQKLGITKESLSFDNYFTNKFNGRDLIFYTEEFNPLGQIQKLIPQSEFSSEIFNELSASLPKNFRFDYPTLKKLLSQNIALALYETTDALPAITLAIRANENKTLVENAAKKINSAIETYLKDMVEKKTAMYVDGSKMNQFEIKIPDFLPNTDYQIPLLVGVAEGNLIISTDRMIKDHYGNFSSGLHSQTPITDIALLSPVKAASQFVRAVETFEPNSLSANDKKIIETIFSPFTKITSKSFFQDKATIKNSSKLQIDFSKLHNYSKLQELMEESFFF